MQEVFMKLHCSRVFEFEIRCVPIGDIIWSRLDTPRQFTLKIPAFKGLRSTRIVLSLTCTLPSLTSAPLASVTVSFEKAASSVSVNASETSCGGVVTTAPSDGLVSVRDA